MSTASVVRHAFRVGARDYSTIFTWKTWLGAWFVRVLAQVAFFALVGRMLGSAERTQYLLVGNAVLLAGMVGMWAVNMVAWERSTGTLPLLAASPTHPAVVLASRGSYLVADATLSAAGALTVAGLLFGVPLPWARLPLALPVLVLVAGSAFCFATFAGGLLLGFRSAQPIVTNVAVVTLMALCGVDVPVDVYPAPVRWVSSVLPVTHGLRAIRLILGPAPAWEPILVQAAWEALVGAGWLAVCLLSFHAIVRRGRRRGTLDHSS
ncbi:ABC transporter permease [Streptomyces sp. NPDC020800]|uniref:ABC transporter permease n=1 Tax=Streptomyces sp. NPDC020800 TaxID=3365092 RepID=UPI0037998B18